MKEDFLHHLWQHKKFAVTDLKTTTGESIQILNSGQYLQLAGPDFFNAQIIIGQQKWAGNVEIHLKSSDWYVHNHEKDSNYDSVILHVVWEHDTPIFRKNNTEIPTLELKNYVQLSDLNKYQSLITQKNWIYCENDLHSVTDFIFKNWEERLYFERLERKSNEILQLLEASNNDWEAVLFWLLAKNFGLNTNGALFLKMAKSIPFSVIRKEAFAVENLEALFFGICCFLDEPKDERMQIWKREFDFLKVKFNLSDFRIHPKFSKLRPPNFPTVRLSQLANLYHSQPNLFSKLIEAKTIEDLYKIFKNVKASEYWDNRFNFGKISTVESKKYLSQDFIDLIVINTILPMKYFYHKNHNPEIVDVIFDFYKQMKPEKNSVLDEWKQLGMKFENALETQAFLYQYKLFCNHKKCLNCSVGFQLLKTED